MIAEHCVRAYHCAAGHVGTAEAAEQGPNAGALVIVVLSGILLYCFVVYVIADAMLRAKGYRS